MRSGQRVTGGVTRPKFARERFPNRGPLCTASVSWLTRHGRRRPRQIRSVGQMRRFEDDPRRRYQTPVGNRTVNVLPRPTSLLSVTSPPSSFDNSRTIDRPSPVPSCSRVIGLAAWRNFSKTSS